MRPRRVSVGARAVTAVALGALLGVMVMPAFAAGQDAGAGPPDQGEIAALAQEYLDEMLALDLDGDGVADFDANGDGVPEIPVGEPGDLDLRPGDGVFGTQVSGQIADQAIDIDGFDDSSYLLFNCSGMALSFDADGQMIDWAIGFGSAEGGGAAGVVMDLFPASESGQRAFTSDNPFVVEDRVVYFGRLPSQGDGPRNHVWSLNTAGISVDSGGDDNPAGNNRNAGEVDIGDDTPAGGFLIPSGVFPFQGELDSENGLQCEGQGWVQFATGNPITSAAGLAATGLGVAGIFGLLFNARPAVTWKA